MSHVFISYSHADVTHLTGFVDKLKDAGFKADGEDKDIWIDTSGIEGGEDWRDEIDKALEESFALVILLTTNSVKSTFVLYEWAWALGNNIRVIPILVEDINSRNLPRNFKHPLYERKQYKNWNSPSDQEYVIKELLDLRETSPFDGFIGNTLNELLLPMRFLTRLTLWSYAYGVSGIISHENFHYLAEKAADETYLCINKRLRDFWLSYSSALNRKQKKLYAKLSQQIRGYFDIFYAIVFATQSEFPANISLLENRNTKATEVIKGIENKHQKELDETIEKLRSSSWVYMSFDSYLHNISNRIYSESQGKVKNLLNIWAQNLTNLSDRDLKILEEIIDTTAKSTLNVNQSDM
jgi:hypothetical protein